MSLTAGLLALAAHTFVTALQERLSAESGGRPARERVFAVSVIPIEPKTMQPVIETFGEIRSLRTLELRATAAGAVVWLSENFQEGAFVEAGEALARIDDRDALGRRDAARTEVAEAEAQLRDAIRSLELLRDELANAESQAQLRANALERQRNLLERGVGTEAAVETASLSLSSADQVVVTRKQAIAREEAQIDQSTITVERRKIALAEAERRVVDTEIRAEFAGKLTEVDLVQGGLVSANETLARLVDPDALEASFRVSSAQYAQLIDESGRLRSSDVAISLDVGDVDISTQGRIIRDSPAVGEGLTGRLLFASIEQTGGFRPGDFVTVRITEAPLSGVALLPAAAIDSAANVLAVGPEDRLEVVQTRLLRRQGDDVIVAARPLAGREVVTERSPFLGAGVRIRPIRPGAAEEPPEEQFVELDAERRARLVAFVEGNQRMPAEAKERVLAQLRQDKVPLQMVNRIESRIGG
jgi:multidrug efflux pump subunit AcrA (membrane-fusion protein)